MIKDTLYNMGIKFYSPTGLLTGILSVSGGLLLTTLPFFLGKFFGAMIFTFGIQLTLWAIGIRSELFGNVVLNKKISQTKESRETISKNIDFLGGWKIGEALSPLTQVREYLKERHERRKDMSWRIALEHQKMMLENVSLKTEILSKQIDLLKKANITEENIRKFVMQYYYEPLSKLNIDQDTELIELAEIIKTSKLLLTESKPNKLPLTDGEKESLSAASQ